MTIDVFLLVLLAGVVTGVLGALLGIGGDIFLIPVLVVGFHLPMHQAIAASIVAVIATSSATASVYVRNGLSNIRLGMSLEVMTAIGALIGGYLANDLPGDLLRRIFAVFLVAMAGLFWWRSRPRAGAVVRYDPAASIQGEYHDPAENRRIAYSVRNLRAGMLVSFFAGNISGLLGVGGGIIKVPVMTMVCGVPMKASTATSNFMIGVTAVASAFLYLAHGHVNPYFTAAAILGVFAGSRAGTLLSSKIHGSTITVLFILLLLATATRMFL
jgi:uncharacterized membrane protein YfcA